jgi:hypothetical protein
MRDALNTNRMCSASGKSSESVPTPPMNVRCRAYTGKHLIAVSFSAYDPFFRHGSIERRHYPRPWLVKKAENPKQEDDWNWDSDQPEQ